MAKRDGGERRTHNQYRIDEEQQEHLLRAIKRIEKLQGEKDDISEDIKAEYQHLKSAGYDSAAIREFMAERKKRRRLGAEKYDEREDIKDLYRSAIGLGDD